MSYPLTHIEGLDVDEIKSLKAIGIRTTERLLEDAMSLKGRQRSSPLRPKSGEKRLLMYANAWRSPAHQGPGPRLRRAAARGRRRHRARATLSQAEEPGQRYGRGQPAKEAGSPAAVGEAGGAGSTTPRSSPLKITYKKKATGIFDVAVHASGYGLPGAAPAPHLSPRRLNATAWARPTTEFQSPAHRRRRVAPAGRLLRSGARSLMGADVTPDLFSDGGRFFDPERAIDHARQLVAEGADILDIGADLTRPYGGAVAVSAEEELRRLEPILPPVRTLGVPVSIDTMKATVAAWALDAGANHRQ